jgi:hypothetical protein
MRPVLDEPVAAHEPAEDNDWGRIGDTREHLRCKLPEL